MNEEQPTEEATQRVVRVVRDIERRGAEECDTLLSDFLCAAWPSLAAQDQ